MVIIIATLGIDNGYRLINSYEYNALCLELLEIKIITLISGHLAESKTLAQT
jgi:hypothetical protein